MLSTNYVSFYENRTTNKLNAYRLEIRTTPKAEEFEKMLEKNSGRPIFITGTRNFPTGYGIPAISFICSRPTIQENTITKSSDPVVCML